MLWNVWSIDCAGDVPAGFRPSPYSAAAASADPCLEAM